MPVPCRLAPPDADLPEICLTENVVRVPMHPADEFEAFQRLITSGKSVADVAARFGVMEAVVFRRIALARVSPTLLSKYRNGDLNLELLRAFTLTDDHNAQEAVWNQLQPWDRKAQTIRQMLAGEDVPASDKRVRFVGLQNYESAAGLVRRNLFAEGEAGTYIMDAVKLNRLVAEKLQAVAESAKADGWKSVGIHQPVSTGLWKRRFGIAPKSRFTSLLRQSALPHQRCRRGLKPAHICRIIGQPNNIRTLRRRKLPKSS